MNWKPFKPLAAMGCPLLIPRVNNVDSASFAPSRSFCLMTGRVEMLEVGLSCQGVFALLQSVLSMEDMRKGIELRSPFWLFISVA